MPTPNIQLRRLSAELKRLRQAAGLTHEQVSDATGMSRNTLWRIESGNSRPQRRTMLALLDLYRVSGDDRETLVALHHVAGEEAPAWLSLYDGELPGEYPAYVQFESEARLVRAWDPQLIPGLLQTSEYARAVVENGTLPLSEREISSRVQARMARQVIMHSDDPLTLDVVIDESALRNPIGGAETMSDQLRHLAKVARRPNVSVRILPEGVGAHPGLSGRFIILGFKDTPPVVYLENISGDVFLQGSDQVEAFQKAYDRIKAMALGEDESRRIVENVATGIKE